MQYGAFAFHGRMTCHSLCACLSAALQKALRSHYGLAPNAEVVIDNVLMPVDFVDNISMQKVCVVYSVQKPLSHQLSPVLELD